MQVCEWGDSLAVRPPEAVVEALQLKEGDEIKVAGDRTLHVERDRTREEAFTRLRAFARPAPPGFSFPRDEANERGSE